MSIDLQRPAVRQQAGGRAGPAPGPWLVIGQPCALLRDGLVRLFDAGAHGAVQAAATLDEAATLLAEAGDAVLLLDLALPGADGFAGIGAMRARFPGLRIVVLAARGCQDETLRCLAAGALGYVAKAEGLAALRQAVDVVRRGGVHVPAWPAAPAAPVSTALAPSARPGVGALTGRQRDVLLLLAEGRSTKDIARCLDLAVSTIKVHLAAVYRVFGARNRVEALCRAGCLPPLPGPAPAVTRGPMCLAMSGCGMKLCNRL